MPSVRVRENEYFDAALRRFKRACEKAGILTELRRREFYEKPTQERKRKKAAAIKRHMKRISRDGVRAAREVCPRREAPAAFRGSRFGEPQESGPQALGSIWLSRTASLRI